MHKNNIQQASLTEIRQVAYLHKEGINEGFLSSLGIDFLSLLYEAISKSKNGILILHKEGDTVIGFIAGTTNGMGEIYRLIIKRWFALILTMLPIILSPRRIFKIFETIRHSRKLKNNAELPSSELLSISVAKCARGSGIAAALYSELREQFAARGINKFKIIVGDALIPAQNFYRKMGATPTTKVEVHQGTSSTVFVDDALSR